MDSSLEFETQPKQEAPDQQQANNQSQQTQQQQPQQQQQQQQQQQPPYTIPGVLHYLEYEWHKFEVERQEWEVEKAELSARIALLQGEKKTHENLKHDLIRRIKMLEHCLRMERAKYHRLKHGTDPVLENVSNQAGDEDIQHSNKANSNSDSSFITNNSHTNTVTYGRELLKHYLQEIGYTDSIIDIRSNRLGPLLGANTDANPPKNDVVDIGELATLAELVPTADESRHKQWSVKYQLQSHFDCVRALRFSETDSLLVTASEDETIKLWHLTRPSSASGKRQPNLPPSIDAMGTAGGSILDLEPLQTYRGHTSRVLCITVTKSHIFSGAQNGELIMWKIISDPSTADQYGKFDSSLLVCKFSGHDDAVWSVETTDSQKAGLVLISASTDQTLKIWNTSGGDKDPIKVIKLDSSPTFIARIPFYHACHTEADIVVSFCDGKIRFYDLGSCIDNDESDIQPNALIDCGDSLRINSIVIHPTLPCMATADSNCDIKFWDLTTRKNKSTIVAHQDEVTSLACDPTGKYLLSASHDCSVRLWLFEEKTCIQEISTHRRKFDEGIFGVAFHPSSSYFATAGADGSARVFV